MLFWTIWCFWTAQPRTITFRISRRSTITRGLSWTSRSCGGPRAGSRILGLLLNSFDHSSHGLSSMCWWGSSYLGSLLCLPLHYLSPRKSILVDSLLTFDSFSTFLSPYLDFLSLLEAFEMIYPHLWNCSLENMILLKSYFLLSWWDPCSWISWTKTRFGNRFDWRMGGLKPIMQSSFAQGPSSASSSVNQLPIYQSSQRIFFTSFRDYETQETSFPQIWGFSWNINCAEKLKARDIFVWDRADRGHFNHQRAVPHQSSQPSHKLRPTRRLICHNRPCRGWVTVVDTIEWLHNQSFCHWWVHF